ncbi:MAG: hypothetical protein OCD76_24895 [Reichenbachiella sp.]
MKHSLNEAAKLCGRAKSTLSKAIKSGRMSASKNDKGQFEIDPIELDRVFPYAVTDQSPEPTQNTSSEHENTIENSVLKAKLEAKDELFERLKSEIEDLKSQRNEWREQAKELTTQNKSQTLLIENLSPKAEIKPRGGIFGFFSKAG